MFSSPKLSIVIPSYNQHELLKQCLDQIYAVNTENYEIILVDNGSDPPLPMDYCGQLIRNESNLGFATAVNQGIEVAKGEYVILLNNDCLVTPNWDNLLLSRLESYSIVGPRTNFCSGIQRTKIGAYNSLEQLNEQSRKFTVTHANETTEANFIIGFCMAFKGSLWEEIGKFNDSIWPYIGAEIDFCFRVRENGYNIVFINDCYIHHYGSQTFRNMQQNGEITNFNDIMLKADKQLKDKYGYDLWNKQSTELMFTGERAMPLAPNMPNDIMDAHWQLYKFASLYSRGKTILDIACGSGYGSDYLSDNALSVTGGDISLDIVNYCNKKYNRPNLNFIVADATDIPLQNKSFDMVVSLETIEHFTNGDKFLQETARVLTDNGILIISTPLGGDCGNPYHHAYYQRGNFQDILKQYYNNVEVFYLRNNAIFSNSISPLYSDTFTGECAIAVCTNPLNGTE